MTDRRYYLHWDDDQMSRPLGCRQIETLRRFRQGGNDRWSGFIPTLKGEPWDVLQSLMRRGLMAVKKERLCFWDSNDQWSTPTPYSHYACLTVDGDNALLDIDFQQATEINKDQPHE